MAQIGIQGLGTRDAEHHRPQNNEGDAGVGPHEQHRVMRAERLENARVRDDLRHAQHGNHYKPDQRDGAKKLANAGCAMFLNREQAKQNHQRDWDHALGKSWRYDFKPFNGRQHRDGRCDDAIAIKQRGAKNTHHQQHPSQLGLVLHRIRCQRQHGDQAALAVVVGPQHKCHVLDRDNDRHGPKEDGHQPIDVVGGDLNMPVVEDFLDGIQNAGADVAVDDADSAQGERRER